MAMPSEWEAQEVRIVQPRRWGRRIKIVIAVLLALILLILLLAWSGRREIAGRFIERELEKRGVEASYTLERIGFRTQEVRDLVIGDPRRPDLVARHAIIQTRLKLNGSFAVYRIYARGVRLRGELVGGKVRWGQIDKLLPPPSDKPFALPDFALDIADSSIALRTPFGPVGIALNGAGKLSGGFDGRAVVKSTRLAPGKCVAEGFLAAVSVKVIARHPILDGPLTLDRFACPQSRFLLDQPRFETRARFNESFTEVDGRSRMAVRQLTAGANGLAAVVGNLTFDGPVVDVRGRVKLGAQRSRLAAIFADRTRMDARYAFGMRSGRLAVLGGFAADNADLDDELSASVTGPLKAAGSTPLGPVLTAMSRAIERTSNRFDIAGNIRVVNFPGGGAARIDNALIRGPQGAQARISGGTGVTYYWPQNGLRIDGTIATRGGGLPDGSVTVSQERPGAPLSGTASYAPYRAGRSTLTLAPIRFSGGPGGSTVVSTAALVDGPYAEGTVRALRVPIDAEIGPGGRFRLGTSCAVVSFNYVSFGALALDRTRLPVCPNGSAIVSRSGSGPVVTNARISATALNGRLGGSPFRLTTSGGRFAGEDFALDRLTARLGRSSAPVLFDTSRLTGTFAGSGISGRFTDADTVIGNVPLRLSEGSGTWRVYRGDLQVLAAATVSDRAPEPRFYPLRTDNLQLTIAGDKVAADGTLFHPATGSKVADVDIAHSLSSGRGGADLRVDRLVFGPGLQPDDLTRLTRGVVALVEGAIRGTGRIDWTPGGKVTSTGAFTTDDLDLAAPFGPVEGISGTIRFTDLLGLETAPGQRLAIRAINPGILVEGGEVQYQLLPGQLVKIERGQWPFMGGTLVLRETVLNFNRPTAKRLTFEVIGLDARTFVQSLGFREFDATGTFDGVLPMIFDENGGRVVGGRLDARPGGGVLAYNGVINRANLGLGGEFAFDALRNLRFKRMVIRLDGELAGEFLTRAQVEGVGLGETKAARFLRAIYKLPINLNLQIRGPFRALIATAKSFNDPRRLLDDVLDRPLDSIPGITTGVRRIEETERQTQTPPATPEVSVSTTPQDPQ